MARRLALASSSEGWRVTISDTDAEAQRLARSIGAGDAPGLSSPELVIVATPPGVTGDVVVEALATWPDAVVVDVASVKAPIADVAATTGQAHRYVGSHPMAGPRDLRGHGGAGRPFPGAPVGAVRRSGHGRQRWRS